MPAITVEVGERVYTKLVALSLLQETTIPELVIGWVLAALESFLRDTT